MRRLLVTLAAVVLVVVLSILVVFGIWLNQIRLAESLFGEGRYAEAETQFKRAWSGWELALLPAQLVQENRVRMALNLVQIGYLLGKHQETMQFLKGEGSLPALADKAEYHFWVANLLMQQAISGEANLIETLGECQGEYLESLRKDPSLWDAKYNYEYVNLLLVQLQKGEGEKEAEIKLLLEHLRTDQQRRKKELPPQKRG